MENSTAKSSKKSCKTKAVNNNKVLASLNYWKTEALMLGKVIDTQNKRMDKILGSHDDCKTEVVLHSKVISVQNKRIDTLSASRDCWKTKAIRRSKTINAQNKRMKEVLASRDCWRAECQLANQAKEEFCNLDKGETAKHHHYCALFTAFCVQMHSYGGMSFRSCRHCLSSLALVFGFTFRIPSHVTIRNWVCKAGYCRVHNSFSKDALSKEDYVVWIDESLIIGSEKVLLVIGMPLNKIPTTCAVSLSDVSVLSVNIGHKWQGEDIAAVLADVCTKVNVRYMVSDGGGNLRKAAALGNHKQVQDCTHWVARILEKAYAKDANFRDFSNLIGSLRQKWFSTEKIAYLPPKQNIKLRFANIFTAVDWAEKMLLQWDYLPQQVQTACEWLQKNKGFIEELIVIRTHCGFILGLLKNESFSDVIHQRILVALGVNKADVRKEKEAYFYQEIILYLERLAIIQSEIRLGKGCGLICCSDIIESIFGKFKQKLNKRNATNMTEFLFTIANFGYQFTELELKNALEKVSLETLKNWKKDNQTKKKST